MSSTITTRLDEHHEDPQDHGAGVSRSEPGGRAQRRAGAPIVKGASFQGAPGWCCRFGPQALAGQASCSTR
jgi:hypothetical protein